MRLQIISVNITHVYKSSYSCSSQIKCLQTAEMCGALWGDVRLVITLAVLTQAIPSLTINISVHVVCCCFAEVQQFPLYFGLQFIANIQLFI